MKLPLWISAVSLLVGACFIGYGVYDNRTVDLWPPKIHSKDPSQPRTDVVSTIEYLKNFNEIVEKANEVITLAHSELWMAVDVPAYGAITVPAEFKIYEASLLHASRRPGLEKKVLWFNPDIENKYNRRVEKLDEEEIAYQDNNGAKLRNSYPDAVGSDLPVLAFHNFWLSKDEDGQYHAVATWFAIDSVRSSQLVGIYSNSPEMADLLKSVWQKWKELSKDDFSHSLNQIYNP